MWNLQGGHHGVLADLVSILGEGLLLDQDAVSIVDLMGTGLEIAKLGTGRISVIDVENEGTLKETARIVQRKPKGVVIHVHQVQGGAEVEAVVTAGVIVTVDPDHL